MFVETTFVTAPHLCCWQRSRRQKRSSGKFISEAAQCFRNLCVYKTCTLCNNPSTSLKEAIQYSEEAFQFCSAAGVIFWDAYRILKLLESFSTGNFNSHFDLYSNECITRLQSLSHLNYQSSFLFPYFNSFPYELCCTTTIELSIPATFFQHSINKYAKMKYFWKPGELWYVLLVQFTCTLYNYDGYKTNK